MLLKTVVNRKLKEKDIDVSVKLFVLLNPRKNNKYLSEVINYNKYNIKIKSDDKKRCLNNLRLCDCFF